MSKFKFTEGERVDICDAMVSYDADPDYSFDSVIDRIEQILSKRDGWISVEDALPDCLSDVLCWLSDTEEMKAIYYSGQRQFYDMDLDTDVTNRVKFWQPLPSAPKTKQ